VTHRTRGWAAIIAKQDDVVKAVITVRDPLEEIIPKRLVLIRLLPLVEKEVSDAIALVPGICGVH